MRRLKGAWNTRTTCIGSEVIREGSAPIATGTANENRTVDVTVRNTANGLEGTLPGGFTYGSPAIVVTAIDPSRGPYTGATEVTVTGQGFPVGGSVTVELAGVRQAGADLTFTYTVATPAVSRVAPTFGPQLGNTVVTVQGAGFEAPVRVVFAKDAEEFAASVQSVSTAGDEIRVSSPRVPDSIFPEVDCVIDDGSEDGAPGKRYVEVTVDVRVTNQGSGCTDTFGNAFTYSPTNPNCRQVSP